MTASQTKTTPVRLVLGTMIFAESVMDDAAREQLVYFANH